MAQFTAVLTREHFQQLQERKSAMPLGVRDISTVHPGVNEETLKLAQQLMLQVPEFSWTIEVDILGRHRVTIHFKGAGVSIDED